MNGKILITGGYGNLGSWMTKYLAKLDYELYILTREEKNSFPNIKYNVIEADISNIDDLKNKLDFDIDFCIHMASYNEFFHENYFKKALEINTLGTRNLLEVLSKKNIKNFIYFSTFHVYGVNSGVIDENTELNPKNDYAITHLFAEYYLKQFGFTHNLRYTILRLTNSYGCPIFINSNKWYLVLNDLCKQAYDYGKIKLNSNGKAMRDFIYMGDVSYVVHQLLNIEATNEIYNLSSENTLNILFLVSQVKEFYEKEFKSKLIVSLNENDKNVYKNLLVKNNKLMNIVSFKPSNMIINEIINIFKLLKKGDSFEK